MRISDWSSYVCSSDLGRFRALLTFPSWEGPSELGIVVEEPANARTNPSAAGDSRPGDDLRELRRPRGEGDPSRPWRRSRLSRAERRRVGKEGGRTCRYGGWRLPLKKHTKDKQQ